MSADTNCYTAENYKGDTMSKYKTILFDWEGVIGPQDTQSFGWLMERLTTEYSVEREQVIAALSSAIGDFLVGKIDNRTFWERAGA